MNSSSSESYKRKGALLPEPLRPYAKAAYLIRDNEGVHLYDEKWVYVTSIKFALQKNSSVTPPSGPYVSAKPADGLVFGDEPTTETKLSGTALIRQVQLIVDRFQHAVLLHGIRADYFFENRLGKNWLERWGRIWNGDLSPLFEDTQEFVPGGDLRSRERGGLNTLKAGLIHELYVNSTLAGRTHGEKENESGRNMLNLLLFVCQLNEIGEMDDVGGIVEEEEQKRMIDAFQALGEVIEEKKLILQRVHQKIVFDFKRGRIWPEKATVASVKSTLIFKLYENTNRMDRGDGTDMVRIVRELLAMRLKKE